MLEARAPHSLACGIAWPPGFLIGRADRDVVFDNALFALLTLGIHERHIPIRVESIGEVHAGPNSAGMMLQPCGLIQQLSQGSLSGEQFLERTRSFLGTPDPPQPLANGS